MNYNKFYGNLPAFAREYQRKLNKEKWVFNHEEIHTKGFTASYEFRETLQELADERNRDYQVIIKDSLWHLMERDRDIWIDSSAYQGNAQVMFKCSKKLIGEMEQYCVDKQCSLTLLCKQAVLQWFMQSETDFDSIVKEKGDTDAGL